MTHTLLETFSESTGESSFDDVSNEKHSTYTVALDAWIRQYSKLFSTKFIIFKFLFKIYVRVKDMNRVGSLKSIKNSISEEYQALAIADKDSAIILGNNGFYRQASYFLLQAMEKMIRAKIFTLIDSKNKYFRDRNRSHSLIDAIELLIEIVSRGNSILEMQHKNNINQFILGNLNYQQLHNNLRYPWFSEKYQCFNLLDINEQSYLEIKNKYFSLEKYLKDLH